MTLNEIIEAIIGLPSNYIACNTSPWEFLKKSGYFAEHEQISDEIIRQKLAEHPERVNEWVNYSENKRSTPGWFLKTDDKRSYIVGYIDSQSRITEQNEFVDPITACAKFIKKEIEAMRKTS